MMMPILQWYIVVQVMSLVALPLSWCLLSNLPDRGYAFTKVLGIFGTGLFLWLGTSYGLLRNERGGALLAMICFGAVSLAAGWDAVRYVLRRREFPTGLGYVVVVELFFATMFLVWALVRSYDPAANHTEQPMDLMFMNSIATSPTFPPVDAWLAGYSISYYYFGYWLLVTIANLALVPISVAYNVGQACWYALLFTVTYGLASNILLVYFQSDRDDAALRPLPSLPGTPWVTGRARREEPRRMAQHPMSVMAMAGGFLSALFVTGSGNVQFLIEWLYANGILNDRIATWLSVPGFPQEAAVTNMWYVDEGWWWWRTSRVFEDLDLFGRHIEVISEFPAFSYLLGDNHPHVLAMPFVVMILAIGFSLVAGRPCFSDTHTVTSRDEGGLGQDLQRGRRVAQHTDTSTNPVRMLETVMARMFPAGRWTWPVLIASVGALLFLNTWDFLPYWLLVSALFYLLLVWGPPIELPDNGWKRIWVQPIGATVVLALAILVGSILLYFPYFLTAQSQAQGFIPNLFHPTKLRHILLMFGGFVPVIFGYLYWGWSTQKPGYRRLLPVATLTLGIPVGFLVLSAFVTLATPSGRATLAEIQLPDASAGYLTYIVERWVTFPYTFLCTGALLAVTLTLLLEEIRGDRSSGTASNARRAVLSEQDVSWPYESDRRGRVFILLLLALGLALIYVPEFVYLRDNFGTRMNTVFKFYYQAWLLFGIVSGCAIILLVRSVFMLWKPVQAVRADGRESIPTSNTGMNVLLPSISAMIGACILAAGLLFPFAGAYAKTSGFGASNHTLDAMAYVQRDSPDEWAAIAWVKNNTEPDAIVLEGKGASYWATYNRISTGTGRPTLLGWDGHEAQWRGAAYGEMAAGRVEAINTIYRTGSQEQVMNVLRTWSIDYVYLGPTEVSQYEITPRREEELSFFMDTVFEQGRVKIFRRRE